MKKTILNLTPGDRFHFVDDFFIYTVAGVVATKGGGCGMGEYPGTKHVITTEGHHFRTDGWSDNSEIVIKREDLEIVRKSRIKMST